MTHHDFVLHAAQPQITQFLNGGLPRGCLIEMGMPLGKEGRQFLLPFLAQASQKKYVSLWINGHVHLNVFAPMILAHRVHPDRIIVANADRPVAQLKPALINPLVKVIVIDSAAGQVNADECAFLRHQARHQQKWAIVLRPYLLTNKRGNPWAKLRLNVTKDHVTNQMTIQVVRGGRKRQLSMKLD